jgi:sec-independent protein translocase protein TatB
MPQIGWFELLIIVVVAILIIGPKDFPIVLKKIGTWTKTIKKYFSDLQSNVSQITNLEEEKKTSFKEKKKINKDENE